MNKRKIFKHELASVFKNKIINFCRKLTVGCRITRTHTPKKKKTLIFKDKMRTRVILESIRISC